jgi:predicted small secreted protein
MMKMVKRAIYIFALSFSLVSLNACSTIEGAGKDIQGAGQVIEKEAKGAKRQ